MRLPRLGLRARVSVAFGAGALGVSVLLAVTTYAVASTYLLDQRYRTVLRQAVFNAAAVDDAALTNRPALGSLLERLDASGGESSSPLVRLEGRWYDDQFPEGHRRLPAPLLAAVEDQTPVWQRFRTGDGISVAIALPLESSGGTFVEVFELTELDRTLDTLSMTFIGTATMTTLLGLMLGVWASGRSLRPLASVNRAAAAIARGNLDARIEANRDPDLSQLADAFNRTAAGLQERVKRDARFAANVSHELRSPLTTMVNAVELLSDRADELEPEAAEVLRLLVDDVHRFSAMVEDLLEISRSDAGAASLELEPVRIGELVRAVADRRARRPVTEIFGDAEDLVCWVDRRRVERVVANLVNNAQTHGRGVTRVVVARADGGVRIMVEDDGPGVPPGLEGEIFERFSRGTGSREADPQGVGLGLALVLEHVRAHQGRVWAEPRRPHGTLFVVELPEEPV